MPFEKGRAKTGGRVKGTTVTVERLRTMCVQAMDDLGSDDKGKGGALGYIRKFAQEERKTRLWARSSRA